MKKLITVCWSYTVEADVPDGVGVDELEDYMLCETNPDLAKVANTVVREASNNINWKDGVITDVQDI